MWDYIQVLISVVLLALGFILQKVYQKGNDSTVKSGVLFSIVSAICSLFWLVLLNGFSIGFTWYSTINSVLKALCGLLYTVLGFQIMKEGKVAFYMLFLMSGGMLVPCVWGWLFLDEPVKPLHVISVIIIVISIVLSNLGGSRPGIKTLLKCCAVFMLNGFVSVFSKLHQINSTYDTVGTTQYAMISTLASLGMSLLLWAFLCIGDKGKDKRKGQDQKGRRSGHWSRLKTLLIVPVYSAIGSASSLLQLEGAKNLPASVLYPMITGGTIVLTGLFARLIFKEKLSVSAWIGIVLCVIGTCLFI